MAWRTRRRLSALEALALLQDMPDCDSDGDNVDFTFEEEDSTDAESSSDEDVTAPPAADNPPPPRKSRRVRVVIEEDSADEEATSDEDDISPGSKKRRVSVMDTAPKHTEAAKDGSAWVRRKVEDFTSQQTMQMKFSGTGGPTEFARRKMTSPLQSFLCLVDLGMLETIRDCTVQQGRRREQGWKMSVYELMAFIAVLFIKAAQGSVGPMRDLWSKDFGNEHVKATMPRNRFQDIMKYLRFDNKDTRSERVKTDKFAAISNIWQQFVQNCVLSYSPGQHITVDEQLFPSKARCPFLQYTASKPGKFGIKFWIAADLDTKYMCNAMPCLGGDPSRPTGERLSEKVVVKLIEPFLDQGRTVTVDNLVTSLSLANRLLQRNTTLLGTMSRIQQELPATANEASGRQLYSTQLFTSGSALLTVYAAKKKKSVCLLSTMHQKVEIGETQKQKPNTVVDYNHLKCGVDIMEQKLRTYSVRAGTRRWPVAVFYNLLDMAATNAHVLYKGCTGSQDSRREFILQLADELRHRFMQEKAMQEEKMRRHCEMERRSDGETTQCQVRNLCNRKHSTERCVHYTKYTCRKCRKGSPWVCGNC